ncbi:DoxX family protein [Tessaracoccus antarcticus]|uniref:DoxX family protein n=2 Tax=Tessaracoccus antarcticus TaxID=2479848 RepID=A0A3M0GK06_9ACTN|nr:DoxX family protein [Tessaracoccus antarcticus]
MSSMKHTVRPAPLPLVETWPWARALFSDRNWIAGTLWLVVRVLLGWQWLVSGVEKFQDYGPWKSGVAVQGFAKGARGNMTGAHPGVVEGTFGWNKAWLSFVADDGYKWIGPVIPFMEVIVGVLLILGLFTGIAALVGLLLNVSFLFAGNAGVNPFFALTAGALIAAWRVAGYFGLDYWVLPLVGVPWSGRVEGRHTTIAEV